MGRQTPRLEIVLDRIIKLAIVILVIIMTIVGFLQVFYRYVLKDSLSWSEELIRYCFIWSTFLCVPVGIKEGKHVSIDIIKDKMPRGIKKYYEIAICLVEFVIFFIMIKYGWIFATKNIYQLSPAMKLPMFYVILSIPFGGVVGILYVINQMFSLYKEEK